MAAKTLYIILICLLLLLGAFTVCGAQVKERWAVKTLADGFTPSKTPQKITVAQIQQLHLEKVGNQSPRLASEKRLLEVSGIIMRKVHEADGDLHVEIKDNSSDSTLTCEFVDPLKAKKSPFVKEFKAARAVITKKKVGDHVTISGVEFQDKFHAPSKMRIRNFIEIHPALSIR